MIPREPDDLPGYMWGILNGEESERKVPQAVIPKFDFVDLNDPNMIVLHGSFFDKTTWSAENLRRHADGLDARYAQTRILGGRLGMGSPFQQPQIP